MVTFSEEAFDECRWWVANIIRDKVNGRPPVTAHPTVVWEAELSTDGSATGRGAFAAAPPGRCPQQRNTFLNNILRLASPSVSWRSALRAGQSGIELAGNFSTEVCKTSSTRREFVGGTESVETMGELLRDTTVQMNFHVRDWRLSPRLRTQVLRRQQSPRTAAPSDPVARCC